MIKKIIFRSLFFLLLFLLLLFATLYYLLFLDSENKKSVYYHFPKEELSLIQEGDIVLRKGYGYFSRFIAKQQDAKYPVTHCGMIIGNNKHQVLHSLSSSVSNIDGVQLQPLQKFLNESEPNSIIIVRYKDFTQEIINQAKHYLEREIPFDHNFNLEDTTKMYCTELFRNVFFKVNGFDIFEEQLQDGKDYCDLTTFLDTNHFQIISNHFQ